MFKNIMIILILGILFLATGCGQAPMDQPADDGYYHYRNEDLGFTVAFPAEFEYYQTQRRNYDEFIDMEYFVPTSDLEYPQQVPGYAKVLTIRVVEKTDVENSVEEYIDLGFEKTGEDKDRLYLFDFWNSQPADWQDKWSEEMRSRIVGSFEVI